MLSATYGGRVHDKRIAEATPYPLPAGSQLLQDLGFLAFTLSHVEILMPTKKPRGEELTREQQRTNQALHSRRLRIEHVNSSVKRCHIVKDRIRLWVVFQKWRWPFLHWPSKGIAVDKQTNDGVVHLYRF